MFSNRFQQIVIITILSIVTCSCGGGGGSGTSSRSQLEGVVPAPTPSPAPGQNASSDPNIDRYYKEEFYENSWGAEILVTFSGFNIKGLKYYNSDRSNGTTEYDFPAKTGVTTYFHLGSIEFFPVVSSVQLSIFHMLRTHNHRSDEVINLTRLLMLLDENNSQSSRISLPQNAHNLVSEAGIVLSDLYVDINSFENSDKVLFLLNSLGGSRLPEIYQAEEYLLEHFGRWLGIDNYAQWPAGFEIDFDQDGVLNDRDAFPWDATQWRDEDGDREGDSAKVIDLFLDTNGVFEYEIDVLNGFLYVADYKKNLHRFDIQNGQLLSSIELDDYITINLEHKYAC